MPKDRSDFAQVRITDDALAALGHTAEHPAQLRISNAHSHYVFTGAAPQEVLRTEWATLLKREQMDGKPLFAIAADESAVPEPNQEGA